MSDETEKLRQCVQALMGAHIAWVKEVRYTAKLQYLLVVLRSGVSRQQLEGLQPEFRALEAACSREELTGVCVTCQGVPLC